MYNVPICVNFYIDIKKKKAIKIGKKIINILNENFSGNSESIYKINTTNKQNISYDQSYIEKFITNENKTELSKQIYSYINTNSNTNIKFNLIKTKIKKTKISKFESNVENLNNKYIHINIINDIKFNGLTYMPWFFQNNQITPQIFISYYIFKKNKIKTIIHEMGHLFGLFHTFDNIDNCHQIYKLYMGDDFYNGEYLKSNDRIYYDIPSQTTCMYLNPFDLNYFQLNDKNEVTNFCNYMCYNEDCVLTHFTQCQINIMIYFIEKYFKDVIFKM